MDGVEKGCKECNGTCCLVHRTNLSPVLTSFFKIMIGDDFSRVLFLPPKFACAVSALVGRETILEDSCGQEWEIMISEINGSVVFKHGWCTFAADHDLEVGDFVLFFRTRESRFLVKIYDRTSCEKLNFPERSSEKKRKRNSLSSNVDNRTSCKTNTNSIDKNCSSNFTWTNHEVNDVVEGSIILQNTTSKDCLGKKYESACKAEFVNEMDYMISKDLGETQGEDRTCILDLSAFEVSNFAEERIPQVDDNEVAKERASEAVLSDSFNHDKSNSVSDKDSYNLLRPRHPEEDGGNVSTILSNGVIEKCQIGKNQISLSEKCYLDNNNGQSAKREINGNSGTSSIPISVLTKTYQSGKIMKGNKEEHAETEAYPCKQEASRSLCVETKKVIKEEAIEIEPSPCSLESIKELHGESSKAARSAPPRTRSVSMSVKENDKIHPVVKTEVIELVEGYSMAENSPDFFSLSATCNQSFVELPECLPFPTTKGMANVGRKMVILRDQAGRMWPVMYHDKPHLHFLASGWEALSKANCINTGDQCLFSAEDKSDGIYSISVIQR